MRYWLFFLVSFWFGAIWSNFSNDSKSDWPAQIPLAVTAITLLFLVFVGIFYILKSS